MIERLRAPEDPERWLQDLGIDPQTWSAGPGTQFAVHSHAQPKRLVVRRGSIRFNDDEWLHAPAGIRIPAGFEHNALVGDDGVDCVEGFESTTPAP
ncbi:MAG: cupin [Candidatus Dormibacteraeota bacterium]|nr:cupin [Candidatus Dormibacteraeota bacterium]